MRLVNADALDDTFIRLNADNWQLTRGDYKRMDAVLFEMPTIDAVPVVHGEWIVQTGSYDPRETWIKCSVCNYPTTKSWGETKYCPNCGAKMGGGAE